MNNWAPWTSSTNPLIAYKTGTQSESQYEARDIDLWMHGTQPTFQAIAADVLLLACKFVRQITTVEIGKK